MEILQGDLEMQKEYPLVPCPRTHPPQALFCVRGSRKQKRKYFWHELRAKRKVGWGGRMTAKIPYFHICFQLYLCQVILLFDETNPRN